MSIILSLAFKISAMPLNILRLLNLTTTGMFNSANDLSIMAINSNSFTKELEPITSASHW